MMLSVLSRLGAQRVEAGGCVGPVAGAPEQLAGLQEGAGDEVGPGILLDDAVGSSAASRSRPGVSDSMTARLQRARGANSEPEWSRSATP